MSWCYARHKYFPSITCVTLDKYPVLLLHGLLQASGTFCVNDESSLAFYLCKSGYDVWMGNNRGYFKPEHKTLKPSDPKFWAWNLQEMASLDLPAMVSFVCAKTNYEKVPSKIARANLDCAGGTFTGCRTLVSRYVKRTSPATRQITFLSRSAYTGYLRRRFTTIFLILFRQNHVGTDLSHCFRRSCVRPVHVGHAWIHSWTSIRLARLPSVQFPLFME